jgi:hypothetical protein
LGDKIEKNETGGVCSAYGEGRSVYTGIWWGNLTEIGHFGDPGIDGRKILRCIFRKWDVVVWTGSCWLRIGAGVGHL